MGKSKYKMSMSLNVLNHLGLNLYSNVPAVLSEVVANSWDADATQVDVDIAIESGKITITDDGHGMSAAEKNVVLFGADASGIGNHRLAMHASAAHRTAKTRRL